MPESTFSKTKIVATVGPASESKEMLRELISSGVNVFRLNFSHGEHENKARIIERIREVNKEMGTYVSILQDLQGPKIRIGEIEGGEVAISPGHQIVITTEEVLGNASKVSTTYKNLAKDVNVGDMVLVDDGNIELEIKEIKGEEVKCEVRFGEVLKSRKGINLPFTKVTAPSLTPKDRQDLEFGIEHEVDWVALSFVRSAQDVIELKEIIKASGKDLRVIAKIEKPEALQEIDEIIEVSDALMVARGDLGVEIVMEEVPMAQKMIVEKCNNAAKPVIIATQMMESMIKNPRPTRAETNDVANAVMDGADALMLSAETAVGAYPVEVVTSMRNTILSVQTTADIYNNFYDPLPSSDTYYNDNVVLTAAELSFQVNAKALIGNTVSGYTAFKLSSHRPEASIFIFTPNKKLLTKLSLLWGVRAYFYDSEVSTDQTFKDHESILKANDHISKGDIFITTASMPIRGGGRTNMLKLNIAD